MWFSPARPWRAHIRIPLLVAVGVISTAAWSSDPEPPGPDEPAGVLTLARAIDAAFASNPDLAAGALEMDAADARIEQAGLRRNPELTAGFENFAGSGELSGTDALESTLSLSQAIEFGGKRRLREEVASLDRGVIDVERQAQQLDVLAEVKRRFITLIATQEQVALASATRAIAQRTLDAISARVKAARSPEVERSRALIALKRAAVEEQQADSELRSARFALAAMWGSQQPNYLEAVGDLFSLEPIEPFAAVASRLEQNPDYVRFASEARLRDAELRLAQAQSRPDVVFGVGMRRLEASGDMALVASMSVPLHFFDRNQGRIREAEVRLDQTGARQRAAFARAHATLFALYQQLIATRTRVEILRNEALPQAQEALDQTYYGYERGRFSYLELATAQQELLELRAAIIGSAADYHRVVADVERLTNVPIGSVSP